MLMLRFTILHRICFLFLNLCARLRMHQHCQALLALLAEQCGVVPGMVDRCLDDQTQVDSKPAGQPEHASRNQCQLIAAIRQKMVLWAPPAGGADKVTQYCNRCEIPDWSLLPLGLVLMPYLVLLA